MYFNNANWDTFYYVCGQEIRKHEITKDAIQLIIAKQSIQRTEAIHRKKIMRSWWTKKCDEVLKSQNKTLKVLKKTREGE